MSDSGLYLPSNASKARLREAENSRKNRLDIVKALSHGQVSRRELVKWGLFTAGGLLAPIHGLNPFVGTAKAGSGGGGGSSIPTGGVPSPGTAGLAFTQPMMRMEELTSHKYADYTWGEDAPTEFSNQKKQACDPMLGGGFGPCEGRPPGPNWCHQRWNALPPKVCIEVTQEGAKTNPKGPYFKFHPSLPTQAPNSMWTFNGTIPPKLVMGRYGEPILFRHHNRLPADVTQNNGFGRHTISTHEHNGHHGAENDGFTGAFFFPGQFYDYHWPIVLAGCDTINANAHRSARRQPRRQRRHQQGPG